MKRSTLLYILSLLYILVSVMFLLLGIFSSRVSSFLICSMIFCLGLINAMFQGYDAKVWLREQIVQSYLTSAERALQKLLTSGEDPE